MALPLTLSNYAIAYGESEVPVYVYPEKGFLLTSVAMHGFARRECRFLNFLVQRQFSYDDITVLLNIRGVGNVFYVCEGGEWKFLLDEAPCNIEAKPYTNNNTFSIEIKDDAIVDMIAVYGDAEIVSVVLDLPEFKSNDGNPRIVPLDFYVMGMYEDEEQMVEADGTLRMTVVSKDQLNDVLPKITYIENLASRINTAANIVLHGENFLPGMNVYISLGDRDYVVESANITFSDDGKTASFTLYPKMLAVDGNGLDSCGVYGIHIGFDKEHLDKSNLGLIRYKYNSENLEARDETPASMTKVGICFNASDMKLVYDTTDENGNGILNPGAGPLGDTMYVRVDGDCTKYKYVQVRLKRNKQLQHKHGEIIVDGVPLEAGDVVWLTHQLNPEDDGLWVVTDGEWYGYGTEIQTDEEGKRIENCYLPGKATPVDDTYVIDLGARVTDYIDYVCAEYVPYKCGKRTVCSYTVVPGDILLLSEQDDGSNGLWEVTCGDWVFLGDSPYNDGTKIDDSRAIITQNNIDFCKCGENYKIEYYYLNASCYLNELHRDVRVMCSDASIVPNNEDHQVKITEYVVRVGEEDSLVGNKGRTPGDPVKEDCTRVDDDFEFKNGISLVENLQYTCPIEKIPSPISKDDGECIPMCDIPRYYNLEMPNDYTNSNDTNGFTIKFWRHEDDGWHLYAYICSGTLMTGRDFYVYHLHVKGSAVESLVDVNEHSWFNRNGGVIASGDIDPVDISCIPCEGVEQQKTRIYINSFAMTDDTWEFPGYSDHNLDSDEKLYMSWRIKCTTSILARRLPGLMVLPDATSEEQNAIDINIRTTCDDMNDDVKRSEATGDECVAGYIAGMEHIWGFAYYKSVMSKSQFCAEYNKYLNKDQDCIYIDYNEVLTTDADEKLRTDDCKKIRR